MPALRNVFIFSLPLLLLVKSGAVSRAAENPSSASKTVASTDPQQKWEETFRSLPDADRLRETMKRLSARPHHLGSAYDKENAEWILAQYMAWGFDAKIETFDALFPTPKERVVELVAPKRFVAALKEPPLDGDPTSAQVDEQLPVYNAGSIDGDVTAPLVYVNYGIPDDYEELDRRGISVKGAIVLARYGGSWRGIKPKVAAEHGAVGCLIYSDPHDDGYFQGDVFPKGAWRPPFGAQRGSVLDMPLYPGDPQTPGVGATPNARHVPFKDVKTLTKIPVLPISYSDAQPLLESLEGPMAPDLWRGSLPTPYHLGPGPAKVHLKVAFDWKRVPIYNVIAKIPGVVEPDEWVLRGNHHDAWVNGADDPVSGQAALLEEARAFGELLKQGWKPRRTIVYCSWDGEEQGLFGSTEWVETHEDELRRKAVAYINSDGNGRGYLGAGGSHTLEKFINGVARDIQDPEKKISVWRRLQLSRIQTPGGDERGEIRSRGDLRINALGSGSDYSPFLNHLGIASLNLSYGGEGGGGVYHSAYDDYFWYTHFSDTDFSYGKALAQTAGTAVLRLADADVLPFDFTDFADTVKRYADELQKLNKRQQDEAKERNRQFEEGVFEATSDPKEPLSPPPALSFPPYLNFTRLQNALDLLSGNADRYKKASDALKSKGMTENSDTLRKLNRLLIESERRLISTTGLPNRPWYRHLIYAPGFYTGYGVKTMPGIREAMEQRQWPLAETQIDRVAGALESDGALIGEAAGELEKLSRK